MGFYVLLKEYLHERYPNESKLVNCMVTTFKDMKWEKDFVDWTTLKNLPEKSDEFENDVQIAETCCRISLFIETPFGMFCIFVFLLILAFCICLCICKKC